MNRTRLEIACVFLAMRALAPVLAEDVCRVWDGADTNAAPAWTIRDDVLYAGGAAASSVADDDDEDEYAPAGKKTAGRKTSGGEAVASAHQGSVYLGGEKDRGRLLYGGSTLGGNFEGLTRVLLDRDRSARGWAGDDAAGTSRSRTRSRRIQPVCGRTRRNYRDAGDEVVAATAKKKVLGHFETLAGQEDAVRFRRGAGADGEVLFTCVGDGGRYSDALVTYLACRYLGRVDFEKDRQSYALFDAGDFVWSGDDVTARPKWTLKKGRYGIVVWEGDEAFVNVDPSGVVRKGESEKVDNPLVFYIQNGKLYDRRWNGQKPLGEVKGDRLLVDGDVVGRFGFDRGLCLNKFYLGDRTEGTAALTFRERSDVTLYLAWTCVKTALAEGKMPDPEEKPEEPTEKPQEKKGDDDLPF